MFLSYTYTQCISHTNTPLHTHTHTLTYTHPHTHPHIPLTHTNIHTNDDVNYVIFLRAMICFVAIFDNLWSFRRWSLTETTRRLQPLMGQWVSRLSFPLHSWPVSCSYSLVFEMGSCCPVGRVLDTRDACGLVTPDVSTYKHRHMLWTNWFW